MNKKIGKKMYLFKGLTFVFQCDDNTIGHVV